MTSHPHRSADVMRRAEADASALASVAYRLGALLLADIEAAQAAALSSGPDSAPARAAALRADAHAEVALSAVDCTVRDWGLDRIAPPLHLTAARDALAAGATLTQALAEGIGNGDGEKVASIVSRARGLFGVPGRASGETAAPTPSPVPRLMALGICVEATRCAVRRLSLLGYLVAECDGYVDHTDAGQAVRIVADDSAAITATATAARRVIEVLEPPMAAALVAATRRCAEFGDAVSAAVASDSGGPDSRDVESLLAAWDRVCALRREAFDPAIDAAIPACRSAARKVDAVAHPQRQAVFNEMMMGS